MSIISSIGVVGLGFVGTAVKAGFEHAFKVKVFDRNAEKRNVCGLDCLLTETDGPIFVCVPTPMKADGSCDTSIVEQVVLGLDAAAQVLGARDRVVVIKSTSPPGTTERLAGKCGAVSLVFNPEFLTEANFINDFKEQARVLLGVSMTSDFTTLGQVEFAYRMALPAAAVVLMPATDAELFKYVCNTFLALKVAYCNELEHLCRKLGVNYSSLADHLMGDDRLGKTHWRVPGPDGKHGFGGSCFPKDVNGLLAVGRDHGVEMRTLEAAWATNLDVRPERDWEQLKGRAVVAE